MNVLFTGSFSILLLTGLCLFVLHRIQDFYDGFNLDLEMTIEEANYMLDSMSPRVHPNWVHQVDREDLSFFGHVLVHATMQDGTLIKFSVSRAWNDLNEYEQCTLCNVLVARHGFNKYTANVYVPKVTMASDSAIGV